MFEKLNVSKSPGLADGLHPRILYETRTKITNPLKLIFDASLKLKELPHDWVNANISAIYKKCKKSELCSYRPISLTSILCKIMEQFIRDYIMRPRSYSRGLRNRKTYANANIQLNLGLSVSAIRC